MATSTSKSTAPDLKRFPALAKLGQPRRRIGILHHRDGEALEEEARAAVLVNQRPIGTEHQQAKPTGTEARGEIVQHGLRDRRRLAPTVHGQRPRLLLSRDRLGDLRHIQARIERFAITARQSRSNRSGRFAFQYLGHRREQVARGEGLAQHSQDAALFGVMRLQVVAARCQHDGRDAAGAGVLLEAPAQLQPRKLRHVIIGNEQVGVLVLGHFERFLPVARRQHAKSRVAQLQRYDMQDVLLVVRDENGFFDHDALNHGH